MGVIMNERRCTPPSGGPPEGRCTHKQKTHSTQHTPSRRSTTESPKPCLPPATTKKHRFPSPTPPPATTGGSTRGPQTAAPPPRRRAADRTESAHTRGRAPSSRTPRTARGTAPRRPARRPTTAAPAGIAARHRWHVACSGRSWSRCSRSRSPRRPRAPPDPTPPSQTPASLRSTSAPPPASRACKKAQQK